MRKIVIPDTLVARMMHVRSVKLGNSLSCFPVQIFTFWLKLLLLNICLTKMFIMFAQSTNLCTDVFQQSNLWHIGALHGYSYTDGFLLSLKATMPL